MGFTSDYHLYLTSSLTQTSDLLQRVYDQQVVLERLFIRGTSIYGAVRVNNLTLRKQVSIKYSFDKWKTHFVVDADYSTSYQDTNTDSFLFQLTVPIEKENVVHSIDFVVRYSADDRNFWDNNSSKNYTIENFIRDENETTRYRSDRSINECERKEIAREYCAVSHRSESPTFDPCGLTNIGGACFMNSVLQSLAISTPFTDYIFSQAFPDDHLVTIECLNVFSLLKSHEYSSIVPFPFKQILGHLRHSYLRNQQQDAHEFLIFLLNFLQIEFDQFSPNPIVEQFYGIFQSTTSCLTCGISSSTEELFLTLNLPILSKDSCSLNECLEQLQIEEHLEDSIWFCSKCQCRRAAMKKLLLHRLPKLLIIQLKRFEMNHHDELIKNQTIVKYPIDDLQINDQIVTTFSLYSVINHDGGLHDGHYTTMTRQVCSSSSIWWKIDDDQIQKLSADSHFNNDKAYLLFYATNKC